MKQEINTYSNLLLAIKQEQHNQQELKEDLKIGFNSFVASLSPVSVLQHGIQRLSSDTNVKQAFVRAGLTTASTLLIDAVMGKKRSVKGFLSSILIETLSAAFINRSIPFKKPESVFDAEKMLDS